MKTNDILIYGGIAFLAYELLIKPKNTSLATPVAPVNTTGLLQTTNPQSASIQQNPLNTVINSLVGAGSKLLTGAISPSQPVIPQTPVTQTPGYSDTIDNVFGGQVTAPIPYNPGAGLANSPSYTDWASGVTYTPDYSAFEDNSIGFVYDDDEED